MNRKALLTATENIVCKDRETDYGSPENNFARIADFWTAYLGQVIKPHDVAAMMMLLKIARIPAVSIKTTTGLMQQVTALVALNYRNFILNPNTKGSI